MQLTDGEGNFPKWELWRELSGWVVQRKAVIKPHARLDQASRLCGRNGFRMHESSAGPEGLKCQGSLYRNDVGGQGARVCACLVIDANVAFASGFLPSIEGVTLDFRDGWRDTRDRGRWRERSLRSLRTSRGFESKGAL